jgi:dephospho-CoA kinase
MKPKEKDFVKRIALERINRLMELAEQNLRKHPKRSRYYVELMKKISSKNRVRIPKEFKQRICKKCNSLLVEGITSKTRVTEKVLWKTCLNCGTIKKVFLKPKKKKTLIGLTGNIASGKTLVGKRFQELGAELIQADEVAKEVMNSNKRIQRELKKVFGEKVFIKRKVNSKKLGEIVFANYSKLKKLNSIVHPETKKELKRKANKCKERVIVIEVPLLFESQMQKMFDLIVFVDSKKELRIKRLKKRGLSETEAIQRIKSQLNAEKKKELSDFVIQNNGSIKELREKVEGVWRKIVEGKNEE